MNAEKAMAWFLLGVLATAGAVSTWKQIDRRFGYLERKVNTPVGLTTPPAPDSAMEDRMKEIRRQSAHDFAEVLREEGLVVAEVTT